MVGSTLNKYFNSFHKLSHVLLRIWSTKRNSQKYISTKLGEVYMVEASTLVVLTKIIIEGIFEIVNQVRNNCEPINEQWLLWSAWYKKVHQPLRFRHRLERCNMGWPIIEEFRWRPERHRVCWIFRNRYRINRRTDKILESRWSCADTSVDWEKNISFWWI